MEIYLDANATTHTLSCASAAAAAAMDNNFGNPSSIHSAGLRARAVVDKARAVARRTLGAHSGEIVFLSGATEGIQTAVLSAVCAIRQGRCVYGAHQDSRAADLLLYGATEHHVVPEAIHHWNRVTGLNMQVLAIPVDHEGRHDLHWLHAHAARAALVCTMAANNETGVISDLQAIAQVLAASDALWIVDGVQALGKMPLRLNELPIDYAAFSGHKLYAPKGVGFLYVREAAPFTPLMMGGGQEGALRSGTENVTGIAALGAVLAELETGQTFRSHETLCAYRDRLVCALHDAFTDVVFNAPLDAALPTTLNFSVPGLDSKLLLDLFDAAGISVSAGSACSASKAKPSHVLQAMGLPQWQIESAVRMSFGPASDEAFIEHACRGIRECGEALRQSGILATEKPQHVPAPERLTRFVVNGACCYVVADVDSSRCVIVDPLPELTHQLLQWLRCHRYTLVAVLDTHSHGDHVSSAQQLRQAAQELQGESAEVDSLGWPRGLERITLGSLHLSKLAIPGHTADSTAYFLEDQDRLCFAFLGDTIMPGALGRSDFAQSEPLAFGSSLRKLKRALRPDTLILPGHDYNGSIACTLNTECANQPLLRQVLRGSLDAKAFADAKAALECDLGLTQYQTMACGASVQGLRQASEAQLSWTELEALRAQSPQVVMIDLREPYERSLGQCQLPAFTANMKRQFVPLSGILNAVPGWLDLIARVPLVFFCRSGSRSAQVADALRRLGYSQAWSIAGGIALAPRESLSNQSFREPRAA